MLPDIDTKSTNNKYFDLDYYSTVDIPNRKSIIPLFIFILIILIFIIGIDLLYQKKDIKISLNEEAYIIENNYSLNMNINEINSIITNHTKNNCFSQNIYGISKNGNKVATINSNYSEIGISCYWNYRLFTFIPISQITFEDSILINVSTIK